MKKFINEEKNIRFSKIAGIILGLIAVITISAISSFGVYAPRCEDEKEITSKFDPIEDHITTTSILTKMNVNTYTTTTSLKTTNSTTETSSQTTTTTSELKDTYNNTTENVCYSETEITECEPSINIDEEYVVYKPSTKYVHRSTCRWVDNSCYQINSTEGIDSRKCSECNPDIEIMNEYIEPSQPVSCDPQPSSEGRTSLNYVTETERIMLCNVVGGEYGSDWISSYDKACVVAVVMNRYYDGGWQGYGRDNTIYNVITAPGQFASYYANSSYNWNVTDSCIEAVEYYFENISMFPHYTSFCGDGVRNYFS